MADFVKLSTLVGSNFTVEGVDPYIYKTWDAKNSKMLTSQNWQEGYRKIYPVTTDKGILDLGAGQMGNLLEAIFYKGESKLIGKTFGVKSNGKIGMDIRYFFNPVKPEKEEDTVYDVPEDWQ